MRYLRATRLFKLEYTSTPNRLDREGFFGYYDAAHADDIDTRRSTISYLFFYYGMIISWKSRLHSYVTLSTNHSEYITASVAAREAMFLTKMAMFMGIEKEAKPLALFSDSAGAIAMAHNPVQHEASKHIELADHYVREQVERGMITITHVRTVDMLADALNKILPGPHFMFLISKFMKITDECLAHARQARK